MAEPESHSMGLAWYALVSEFISEKVNLPLVLTKGIKQFPISYLLSEYSLCRLYSTIAI
jgi:hypothetical protein